MTHAKQRSGAREALNADPTFADAYLTLSNSREQRGDWEGAVSTLRDGIKHVSGNKALYQDLRSLLIRGNQIDEIRQVSTEMLDIDEDEIYTYHCVMGDALLSHAWRQWGCNAEQRERRGSIMHLPSKSTLVAHGRTYRLLSCIFYMARKETFANRNKRSRKGRPGPVTIFSLRLDALA